MSKLSADYYVKRGNSSMRAEQALASVRGLAVSGIVISSAGQCLHDVRTQYRIGFVADTAIQAWQRAASKPDYTHTFYNAPVGVPVFWSGGSSGAGHIAIADGKGNCYSTDIEKDGAFSLVPISDIHAKWGLKYLGWSEYLGDTRVYV